MGMQADSSVEAPANMSEAKEEHHSEAHSSHVTKHTKVDGMDAVGIIYGNVGTADSKISALKQAGVRVAMTPSEVPGLVKEAIS